MLKVIMNEEEGRRELQRIGVHPEGIDIMLPKLRGMVMKFREVPPQDALILKQEMLSIGGDAAVAEKALPPSSKVTDVLLMGTRKQMMHLAERLQRQYERLQLLGNEIAREMENLDKKTTMKIGDRTFSFGTRTYLMGILNVTPDSFYDGGKYTTVAHAVERAKELERQGADIIDIGGESSRPFSEPISAKEELERILPVIKAMREEVEVPISVDTYKPEVAEKALERGADMINDIMALRNEGMVEVIKEHDVPVCLMHMKGEPKNMQVKPEYENVTEEVYSFLKERVQFAVERGIAEDRIIIDPGIGFGKRTGKGIEDNCDIIAHLRELKGMGRPVLVGISQKTFIGNILGAEKGERIEGSLGAEAVAIINGADIIRCHHVLKTKRMAAVVDRIVR